jgi:hypothetical protein
MKRQWPVRTGLLLVLAIALGCRAKPCDTCIDGPGSPSLFPTWERFGNARIAPPGTNSYQIPVSNQPYYTPTAASPLGTSPGMGTAVSPTAPFGSGVGAPSSGTMTNQNPAGAVPAGYPSGPSGSPPTGWRASDGSGSSFYQQPNQPALIGTQTAVYPSLAPDYRSTAADERLDPTRMPATDATMVRAPASFDPASNWSALDPRVAMGRGGYPAGLEYRATPSVVGQATGFGPATSLGNPYPISPTMPAVVLAQASTSPELLARDPNFQNGWRDRFTGNANPMR